jgi:hypothetical protein
VTVFADGFVLADLRCALCDDAQESLSSVA